MSRLRRHYSFRLVWRKYYEFLLEGDMFYLIEKAYTTKCHNGIIEWETISEITYKNAVKKGFKPRVVIVEEEFLIIPIEPLAMMFEHKYAIDKTNLEKILYKAKMHVADKVSNKNYTMEMGYKEFIEKVEELISKLNLQIA